MTNKKQPEALRLAEMLTADEWPGHVTLVSYARECVAELRRQHARITELEATPQPTQAQAGAVPLTPEQIQDLLLCGDPTDEEMRLIRIGWDAANGIKGGQHGTE